MATKPVAPALVAGARTDLVRGKPARIAENARLRQQLLALRRRVNRPRCTPTARTLLVLLASRVHAWRSAPLIVRPDSLLRWHRQLFRGNRRRTSRAMMPARQPTIAAETIALIGELAAANRFWGAERIRGERVKLDIRVAKSTVQRCLRTARPPRSAG